MKRLVIFMATLVIVGLVSGTSFGFTLEPAYDLTDSSWWEHKIPDYGGYVQIDRYPNYVKFSLKEEAGEYSQANVARNNLGSVGIVATVTIESVTGSYATAGVIHYEIGRHNGNKIHAMIVVVEGSGSSNPRVEAIVRERLPGGSLETLATLRFPDFDTSAVGKAVTIGLGRLGNAVYFYQAGVDAYLIYQPHYDLGEVGNSSGSGVYTNVGTNATVEATISNVLIVK